jgi:hypothetical protein
MLIRSIKRLKIVKNFTNSACGGGGWPITFAHHQAIQVSGDSHAVV